MDIKKRALLFSLIMSCSIYYINAQVTIGADLPPCSGAILDLKETGASGANSTKGLLLSRVELDSIFSLNPIIEDASLEEAAYYIGLAVYNVKTIEKADNRLCPGIHIWDGAAWVPVVPYPKWEEQREEFSNIPIDFRPLDPANPSDWPEGKNPEDYKLGYIGRFTDSRAGDVDQSYCYTRFYVGATKREITYKIKMNYSCDPANTDGYVENYVKEDVVDVFEDGVWMAENLRAKVNDPVRDDVNEAIVKLPKSPSYNTKQNSESIEWGYPNKTVSQVAKGGIIYTWAAASNGSKATANEEGLAGEAGVVQGICPHGWHLPSDREWSDLENGIIRNTSLFSSTTDLGEDNTIPYTSDDLTVDEDDWLRGKHRTAMLNKSPGRGSSTGFDANAGGFNMQLTGEGDKGGTQSHTYNGYGWSRSSTGDADRIWNRRVNYRDEGVYRKKEKRFKLMTVRCKRN